MILDKSRIPKLSDSSGKFIPKKQAKLMNDPFGERTEKTRNKMGKKIQAEWLKLKQRVKKPRKPIRQCWKCRSIQTPLGMRIGRDVDRKQMVVGG